MDSKHLVIKWLYCTEKKHTGYDKVSHASTVFNFSLKFSKSLCSSVYRYVYTKKMTQKISLVTNNVCRLSLHQEDSKVHVCIYYIYTFEAFTYKNIMHMKSVTSIYAYPTNNGQWMSTIHTNLLYWLRRLNIFHFLRNWLCDMQCWHNEIYREH